MEKKIIELENTSHEYSITIKKQNYIINELKEKLFNYKKNTETYFKNIALCENDIEKISENLKVQEAGFTYQLNNLLELRQGEKLAWSGSTVDRVFPDFDNASPVVI